MKPYTILGLRNRTLLDHFRNTCVFMESITGDESSDLSANCKRYGKTGFHLKDKNIDIPSTDVILFGDININNKEDIKLLKQFEDKLWVLDYFQPHLRYLDVNFKNGELTPYFNGLEKGYKSKEVYDIIEWVKYNLLLLGYPKNIVIYKVKTNDIRRSNR